MSGGDGQQSSRPANRLVRETSPYLLQHAYNPVEWYPWGPEALERARLEEICSQIENQSTVQVLPLQKLVAVQVGTGLHALAAWKEFAGAATPA